MEKDKKVRLVDVARRAGVSRAAAAKILNGISGSIRVGEKARERIELAAYELNYLPNLNAAMLAGKPSSIIGVFIDSNGWFRVKQLLIELERVAAERGLRLMISFTHDHFEHIRQNYIAMRGYGVAGFVFLSHDYPDMREQLTALLEGERDIVYYGQPFIPDSCWVGVSCAKALAELFSARKRIGQRRIALLRGKLHWESERGISEDYRRALALCGLDYMPELEMELPESADASRRSAAVIEELIRPHLPDLIFCDNASDTISILSHCRQTLTSDRMPNFYGGDNDPFFSRIFPAIPSLDPCYSGIVRALLEALETSGNGGPFKVIESIYDEEKNQEGKGK